jgi:hypothetical protein
MARPVSGNCLVGPAPPCILATSVRTASQDRLFEADRRQPSRRRQGCVPSSRPCAGRSEGISGQARRAKKPEAASAAAWSFCTTTSSGSSTAAEATFKVALPDVHGTPRPGRKRRAGRFQRWRLRRVRRTPQAMRRLQVALWVFKRIPCKSLQNIAFSRRMADGVGFEPTRPLRACRFSRPVPSAARPPIRLLIS